MLSNGNPASLKKFSGKIKSDPLLTYMKCSILDSSIKGLNILNICIVYLLVKGQEKYIFLKIFDTSVANRTPSNR